MRSKKKKKRERHKEFTNTHALDLVKFHPPRSHFKLREGADGFQLDQAEAGRNWRDSAYEVFLKWRHFIR